MLAFTHLPALPSTHLHHHHHHHQYRPSTCMTFPSHTFSTSFSIHHSSFSSLNKYLPRFFSSPASGSPLRSPSRTSSSSGPAFPRRLLVCSAADADTVTTTNLVTLDDSASPSKVADIRAKILEALKVIIDPDLNQDIVTLGFIKNMQFSESGPPNLIVSFDVQLTTPACPIKDSFRDQCIKAVMDLGLVKEVHVNMTAAAPNQAIMGGEDGMGAALGKVGAIVAVASCKGGVGKSTTAVNLAYALAAKGAAVGIMDTDIYGPSLPTMVKPRSEMVEFDGGMIKPLDAHGVKLMSFGYINPDSAIMRGPMIANVLSQLLSTTSWGDLDYLILDLPPGTGDVQLTLAQTVRITAAVIVTTPQKLAFVDVVKGMDMFQKVEVPAIAVVENMSYFIAPESGVKHRIFGNGHLERLKNDFGIENTFEFPITPSLSEKSDSGVPYVVSAPEQDETRRLYQQLADSVVKEVAKIKFGGLQLPTITYDADAGDIIVSIVTRTPTSSMDIDQRQNDDSSPFSADDDVLLEQRIWPPQLRRQCRCALCVDEMTGEKKLRDEDVAESVKPTLLAPVGNYALQVNWSDGHSSLYPYSRFVDAWRRKNV